MTEKELKKTRFFADLFKLPEDQRIDLIGNFVTESNESIWFLTDSGPGDEGKADRYIKKIRAKFPELIIAPIETGPVENTVAIRIYPPRKDVTVN